MNKEEPVKENPSVRESIGVYLKDIDNDGEEQAQNKRILIPNLTEAPYGRVYMKDIVTYVEKGRIADVGGTSTGGNLPCGKSVTRGTQAIMRKFLRTWKSTRTEASTLPMLHRRKG